MSQPHHPRLMSSLPSDEAIVDWLFELAQLKRIPRSGWHRVGVERPESVAAHNLRAAQLAYALAHLEGHPDPAQVVAMVVFHEVGETRVGDLDRIAKAYTTRAEDRAAHDQLRPLGDLGREIIALWEECEEAATPAGAIAKDADLLEACFTAREYVETGHAEAQAWIDATRPKLRTASARRLVDVLESRSFSDWWKES